MDPEHVGINQTNSKATYIQFYHLDGTEAFRIGHDEDGFMISAHVAEGHLLA